MIDLTQSRLKSLLSYDPDTGLFTWVHQKVGSGRGRIEPGSIAGRNVKGYRSIKVDQRAHYAHRLAWFYVHGVWPVDQIDHINGDKSDNRICNLRPASNSENLRNIGAKRNCSSGIKGVDWVEKDQRWRARIRTPQGRIDLGYFREKDQAAAAYAKAAHELHGEFAKT